MSTLQEALVKVGNPFSTQAASVADDGAEFVDVATYAAAARKALTAGSARAQSGRCHVVVLLGDAGAGKSHLLAWLRRHQRTQAPAAATAAEHEPPLFLPMPALPDLATPFRHALRVLVGALCRKDAPSGATGIEATELGRPIDRLLWETLYWQTYDLLDASRVGNYQSPGALLKLIGPLCLDGGRRRGLADFVEQAQKIWSQVEPGLRQYLLSLPTEMSIDSAARAVFVQFPYADRRALCTAWLAGEELSAKDRERIATKQVINNEAAAKHVLCSLLRMLAARPGALLTLCYDQPEQVAEQLGPPGLQALAEVIATLQTQGSGVLQILSCRPATWTRMQEKPARPGPGPVQLKQIDATVQLDKPTPADVRSLVAARLQAAFSGGPERPRPLYPLNDRDVEPAAWPGEVTTPRAALAHFAQRFDDRRTELVTGKKDAGSAPGSVSKKDGPSSPAARKDAGSVPGAPVPIGKKDSPSSSGDTTRKVNPVAPATAAKKDAPSSVGAVAKKDGPSSVGAKKDAGSEPGPAAKTDAKSAAKAESKPGVKPAKTDAKPAAKTEAVPEPLPPSSQSPSIQWMAWATDNDPLADAMAQARADLAQGKGDAASASAKAADKKAAESKADKKADKKPEAKPEAKPAPKAEARPVDNVPEPLPPSAQSPSIQWSEWAAADDPLASAVAEARASLDTGAASTTSKPRPVRMTLGMGAVVINPAASRSSGPVPSRDSGAQKRTTQSRIPPVVKRQGPGVSTAQVMAAMGERKMIEEVVLAQQLGVSVDELDDVLAKLENDGMLRSMPMGDGQRMIVREG